VSSKPHNSGASIDVVIVFYDKLNDLRECLANLAMQTLLPRRITIVDNSPEHQCSIIDGDNITVLQPKKNIGFAAGNNMAIRLSQADYIATLNPDAFPRADWLEELYKAAVVHPEAAAFGSVQIQEEDERFLDGIGDCYHVSGLMWRKGYGRPLSRYQIRDGLITSPCGAAALYRKEVFESVGGFDEDFFCFCEDVDLGLRLWSQGWTCRLVAGAIVAHKGSGSTGKQSDFAVYHGHRNLIWVFVKNMPGIWFYFCLPIHLLINMHIRSVISRNGQRPVIVKAQSDALNGLSRAWSKRKECSKRRRVSVWAGLLFLDLSMPPEPWKPSLMRSMLKLRIIIGRKLAKLGFRK
jgi:GT2 family glycosyltransferase